MGNLCQNCGSEGAETLSISEAQLFRKNTSQLKVGEIAICAICNACCNERAERLQGILSSHSDKRLIVAGPGTGKTHTFKEVIQALPEGSKSLVVTFINNLAEDLFKELTIIEGQDVKAGTFHGYCKELLHSVVSVEGLNRNFTYTPNLPILIQTDAETLGHAFDQKAFSAAFNNLNNNDALAFFVNRASYYNAISHTDGVYHVFVYLSRNPDKIPQFTIVIADEFQDFNLLESEFIALLATFNKVLLAGDDDQALYLFKSAKTDFIRSLFNDEQKGYEKHYLPYCSRCSPVIVRATNSLIKQATARGLLVGRIDKKFKPYWPDKYLEENDFPKIRHTKCSVYKAIPKYIEYRIEEFVARFNIQPSNNGYEFMLIGPENRPNYLNSIKDYLTQNLDSSLYEIVGPKEKIVVDFTQEAYILLNQNKNLNLAWRMLMQADKPENFNEIITTSVDGVAIETLLPVEYVEKHKSLMREFLNTESGETESTADTNPRIKILLTNYLGSKGLAANHIFIIGLSNGTFPENAQSPTDEEVCKFLVALTRTKKTCDLVTNREYNEELGYGVERPSVFLGWIPQNCLENVTCNIKDAKVVIT